MTTHEEEIALLKRAIDAGKASEGPGIVLVDNQGTPVFHLDTTMAPHVREALEERLRKIE